VGKPIGADKRRKSKTPREAFGRAVTKKRVENKLSQVDLADYVGVSSNYLGRIERGSANLSCDVMEAVSGYFRMSIGEFWIYAEDLQRRQYPNKR
jgi:transcriptional regulator with XRE-family HTH domain